MIVGVYVLNFIDKDGEFKDISYSTYASARAAGLRLAAEHDTEVTLSKVVSKPIITLTKEE